MALDRTKPTVVVEDGGSTVSIDDGGGTITVDGTVGVSGTVPVSGAVSVDDGGGSITVDGTVTVQDGGGSITVDGTVGVSGTVTVDSELTTADLDTGAGTDTRAVVGLVLAASGGGVLAGAANPVPVSDNGSTLSVDDGGGSLTVDGTVAVSGTVAVTDNSGSLTVDNGGTFVVQENGSALTALQLIDDPVGATAAATPAKVMLAGGTDGTNARALKTDTSGELQIDVLSIAAGTNNIGDVDIASIAAGDNNIGNVDVVTMPNVTLAAGTNTNEVVGDAAHDAAVAGNPVLVGGAAQDMDDTAPPNRVSAEADAVRLAMDRDGAIFAHPHGPQIWSYHVDGSTALTDASVHAAPGAGLSLYVTDIIFSSGAATAINLFFEEGASKVLGPFYLEAVAGRGMHIKFGTPKKITANTALTATTSAAIAHSVDVSGFVAPG